MDLKYQKREGIAKFPLKRARHEMISLNNNYNQRKIPIDLIRTWGKVN